MLTAETKRVADAAFDVWLQAMRANCTNYELYTVLLGKCRDLEAASKLVEKAALAERSELNEDLPF